VGSNAAYESSQDLTSASIVCKWHLFSADGRIVHVTITVTIRNATLCLVLDQTGVSLEKNQSKNENVLN
jgi:hypothetical protein